LKIAGSGALQESAVYRESFQGLIFPMLMLSYCSCHTATKYDLTIHRGERKALRALTATPMGTGL